MCTYSNVCIHTYMFVCVYVDMYICIQLLWAHDPRDMLSWLHEPRDDNSEILIHDISWTKHPASASLISSRVCHVVWFSCSVSTNLGSVNLTRMPVGLEIRYSMRLEIEWHDLLILESTSLSVLFDICQAVQHIWISQTWISHTHANFTAMKKCLLWTSHT